MSDATPTAAVTDALVAVDVYAIEIFPIDQKVRYSLRETYQSGRIVNRATTVAPADFNAAVGSFCQAAPKKKFLTWLVANGYESNLTVA